MTRLLERGGRVASSTSADNHTPQHCFKAARFWWRAVSKDTAVRTFATSSTAPRCSTPACRQLRQMPAVFDSILRLFALEIHLLPHSWDQVSATPHTSMSD